MDSGSIKRIIGNRGELTNMAINLSIGQIPTLLNEAIKAVPAVEFTLGADEVAALIKEKRSEMNKFKVYLSAVARFVVLAGILFFYTAFFYSEAMSCSITNGITSKQPAISKYENFDRLIEEFSFLIQDFKINHQSENNILNIKVRYCYKNGILDSRYPDFRVILKDIRDFLNDYPNEIDYWEIVNKKLTLMVLRKYSVLSSVTSEMQVSPSRLTPYIRSSITTRYQSKSVRTSNKKAH